MKGNTQGNTGFNKNRYLYIHKWISKKYGKAKECEFCKSKSAKRYEWALKRGCEYDKDISLFFQLCPSCHRKYDSTELSRANNSLAQKGRVSKRRRKVSLNNETIYESMTEAAKSNGIFVNEVWNSANFVKRESRVGVFDYIN